MWDRAKRPGCSGLAVVPTATPGRESIRNLDTREGCSREFNEATMATTFNLQWINIARLRCGLGISDGVGVIGLVKYWK